MTRVAFLGLGAMGYPMAGHLARAGHEVRVYNRSPDKSFAWAREYTGNAVTSAAGAAEGCEFVFACVGADADEQRRSDSMPGIRTLDSVKWIQRKKGK